VHGGRQGGFAVCTDEMLAAAQAARTEGFLSTRVYASVRPPPPTARHPLVLLACRHGFLPVVASKCHPFFSREGACCLPSSEHAARGGCRTGCRACAQYAPNTFLIDEATGKARVFDQWADSEGDVETAREVSYTAAFRRPT
jgi:ferredoxin